LYLQQDAVILKMLNQNKMLIVSNCL